ncbi:nucleoporin protein Ndc1-Nup [Crucibulum laeve]|uniref:Nucleoporin protein Ndc1-Nup n=1 Tax=Crucibulum laeve TaxID=68775 RepID=A0A5C3LH03_9AGAR|nr:nucleoporin protein Ndc1-Nup [Crucibulum laeve]
MASPVRSPIRAITSTISTRSAPSIPPASASYDPLIRSVLRHRLVYSIFPYSAIFCWFLAAAWNVWQHGGLSTIGLGGALSTIFMPLTLFNAVLGWVVGVVPIVVLRKAYLTTKRTSALSPSASVSNALSKPSSKRALATYAASAILVLLVHTFFAYMNETTVRGDPKLSLFVKSRKHPHYLNPRLLFLLFTQLTAATIFWLRSVFQDRFAVRWSSNSQNQAPPLNLRLPLTIPLPRSTLIAPVTAFFVIPTVVLPAACLLFFLAKLVFPILYTLPLLHVFLKPFTGHFVRSRQWVMFLPLKNFGLLVRAWWLAASTVGVWEGVESVFEYFTSLPIQITDLPTLISGLSSSAPAEASPYTYFAYTSLASIASGESLAAAAQRKEIYGEQKGPLFWARVVRESLLLLGQDYQLLLRRGAPPPPPAAPPAAPAPIPTKIGSPIPLLRQRVFKNQKESTGEALLDAVGSDGPIAKAVDVLSNEVPELFRSVSGQLPQPAKEELQRTIKTVESVEEKVVAVITRTPRALLTKVFDAVWGVVERLGVKYAPVAVKDEVERLKGWWSRERVSRKAEGSLVNRELDVVVIDALSHLVSGSLADDTYGVVQRDIPRILEALLSFLSAVEEYQRETSALITPHDVEKPLDHKELREQERTREEVEKAVEMIGSLDDALKEGVGRIVRTFGDKLLAFKFPPRTAQKLQGFLDYC